MTVLLVACVEEEVLLPKGDDGFDDDHYFIIQENISTRVSYEGNLSVFEGGEKVGMFALDASGNPVASEKQNACYEVEKYENLTDSEIYRMVLDPVTDSDRLGQGYAQYLVYHPYKPGIKFDEIKNYTFKVNIEQDTKESYEASDLLWDVAVPDKERNCVNIAMDHAMARIFVEIDDKAYDLSKGVVAVGLAVGASGIDLTQNTLSYSADAAEQFDLSMKFVNVIGSGRHMYGALVPAQPLKGGSRILAVTTAGGEKKIFKLPAGKDLQMLPGHNYTISLRSSQDVIIDVDDDDTWVFDVRDPETGEIVGMLCREYLHYQPTNMEQAAGSANKYLDLPDYITGYQLNHNGSSTKAISSQAWVFYNLKDRVRHIPDLNRGTVLRFIKDVRFFWANLNGVTEKDCIPFGYTETKSAWPAPHHFYFETVAPGGVGEAQGLYLADHGHDWVYDETNIRGISGTKPENIHESYMHGGVIEWGKFALDNINFNGIKAFYLPEEQITNKQAYENGHIAIDSKTGEVYVSYDSYDSRTMKDAKNCKVAFIDPVYVADSRCNKFTGELEVITYPIVKIGYNNFWTRAGLKTKLLNDGTPLICYSKPNGALAYDDNNNKDILEAGYVYPYHPEYSVYDDEENRDKFPLLYNHTASRDNKLVSKTVDSRFNINLPRPIRVYETVYYCGWLFPNKFVTDKIRTQSLITPNVETQSDALKQLKLISAPKFFTCNATGFDLKSLGILWWHVSTLWHGDFSSSAYDFGAFTYYWLAPSNDYILQRIPDSKDWTSLASVLLCFNPWDGWGGSTDKDISEAIMAGPGSTFRWDTSDLEPGNPEYKSDWMGTRYTHLFSGVRLVMKMKGQNDPNPYDVSLAPASVSLPSGLAKKSSSAPVQSPSNNVYVMVE